MSIASGASKRRRTAGSRYPARRVCSSSWWSILRLSQRMANTCSHALWTDDVSPPARARTARGRSSSADASEQRHLPRERLGGRARDVDADRVARLGDAGEVDDLVVAAAPAQAARVVARRALDQNLHRAADEPLRPLSGAA